MKSLLIYTGVAVVFVGCSKETKRETISLKVVNYTANYVTYATVDEMDLASDLIFIGRPLIEFPDRKRISKSIKSNEIYDFHTITDLEVSKWIKGPEETRKSKASLIEPFMIATQKNQEVMLSTENYSPMKRGSDYLVFARNNGKGAYDVVNMNNGRFLIDNLRGTPSLSQKTDHQKTDHQKTDQKSPGDIEAAQIEREAAVFYGEHQDNR